jgi:hypothetical protein
MSELAGVMVEDVGTRGAAIRAGLPALMARCRHMFELAELAATGPDPESLLPDIAEIRSACAAFVRAHS